MSLVEKKPDTLFEPLSNGTFTFLCHKGIGCFTQCCAALNLVLTPYDVLRMKNRLGMTSDEFLGEHTETDFDIHARFPMIKLKMKVEDKKCPFVTATGCAIYEDRPAACRIYPIGRASMKVDHEKSSRERFFVVREGHCLGFKEGRVWSAEEWMADQGLDKYNIMNDQWLEIVSSPRSLGPEKNVTRKMQMFFMASYNLDKFRKFVFESSFLQLFDVASDTCDRISKNDEALLAFAMDWLKFSLYGIKTTELKN